MRKHFLRCLLKLASSRVGQRSSVQSLMMNRLSPALFLDTVNSYQRTAAIKAAIEAGIESRYSTIPGSAFEVDYGKGYDLILLTNFLHHFDMTTCERLLEKVHTALAPHGRAVTVDFVPDAGRVSPPGPAAFCMTMLGTTPNGDAYTYDEFKRMLSNAGFVRSELRPLVSNFQQMIISYK